MTTEGALVVREEIELRVDPRTAFDVYTRDIGQWWRRHTHYWNDSKRAVTIRFEPFVGGRFIEVYDERTGEGFEIGRITEWQPGERLAHTWRESSWPADAITEVVLTFTQVAGGTRVSLEHRGWERLANGAELAPGHLTGWRELLGWFGDHAMGAARS